MLRLYARRRRARRARVRKLLGRRVTVTFKGFNTHPGYAKGRMVNAIRLAADFVARLPRDRCRRRRPTAIRGICIPIRCTRPSIARASRCSCAISSPPRLKEKEAIVERLARDVVRGTSGLVGRVPGRRVVPEHARGARASPAGGGLRARRRSGCAGMEPIEKPIRGGTDGSRLSFMGLPTPNLFAGEHNFHSRLEWVSAAGHGQSRRGDRAPVRDLGGRIAHH